MGRMWIPFVLSLHLLLLLAAVNVVQSKVYIVLLDDSPVVHYDGSLSGYAATATVNGSKLNSTSSSVRNYAAYLQTTHDRILATIYPEGGYTKLYSYSIALNGFAVDIPEDQVDSLSTHPNVKQMQVDTLLKSTTTYTPDYLGLPQGAWAQNGGVPNAGEDIVIGLVDTGIYPAHPSFANNQSKPYGPLMSFTGTCEVAEEFPEGSCNYKLIGARHFSSAVANFPGVFKAIFDEVSDILTSPIDKQGHGTHTASTTGGNNGVPVVVDGIYIGSASGIAPRARIAMYKALYGGSGLFTDIVAAIDQAVADGVDILSLSLADVAPPTGEVYFNIFDVALLGAVRAGVFVTQAAGNYGPTPESVASFSPWIVSAAASQTDRSYTNSVTLGNGMTLGGSGLAVGTPDSTLYTMVWATDVTLTSSNPNTTAALCQSSDYFDKKLVQGNLLVCTYDVNSFSSGSATMASVTDTARNLSAAGVIYVTGPESDLGQSPMLLTTHQLPSIIISTDSEEFSNYYNGSTTRGQSPQTTIFGAKAKLNGGTQPVFTGGSPTVASFSSRGPDYNNVSSISNGDSKFLVPSITFEPADVLKPNVMAPGVSIWAGWSPGGVAYPTFQGQNFAIISGTSMATPHIAGIAALVKEKNPTFSPAAIHSALAGTAFSFDKSGAPLQAQYPSANTGLELGPATAYDMGAGQVNALAALDPGLIFEAGIDDYRKFLCLTPTANSSQVLNATGSGCPQNLSGYPSDLNTPYISVGVLAGSRVVPRTVTSVSSTLECFTLHMDTPAYVNATVNPTSFVIAPGQSQEISVTLTALITSGSSSFGALHFYGNSSHNVTIPITVSLLHSS